MNRKWLGVVLVAAGLTVLAIVFLATREAPTQGTIPQAAVQQQATPPTREELLRLVNEERAKAGVAPLAIDERINESAQMKADDMTRHGYFGHDNSDGTQGYELVFKTTGQLCTYASENLTDISVNTSARAVSNWVNSEPHYRGMTNPDYSLTGFGISGTNIVQHFCKEA